MTTATCECGCGQPVRPSCHTRAKLGYTKGQPQRFVVGHSRRTGKTVTNEYLKKQCGTRIRPTHVLIAEKALGHPLPVGAQVHHFDGNKQNNAPSNLVICPDRKYHALLHVRQRVLAAGGDPNTQRICTYCRRLVSIQDLIGNKIQVFNRCRPCNRAHLQAWRSKMALLDKPVAYRAFAEGRDA